jgi:hypothetical protein
VLSHDIFVFPETGVHVEEDHALRFKILAYGMIDDFGLVLGGDTGEELSFGFGDTEAVEGVLDVVRYFIPALLSSFGGLDVVVDVLEIDIVEQFGIAPGRHGFLLKISSAFKRNSSIH